MILNRLKELSNEIATLTARVEVEETEIRDLELAQLQDILKECKGGFKFNYIPEKVIFWNNHKEFRSDSTENYDIKGVYITKEITKENEDYSGCETEGYELWLTQNMELKVFSFEKSTTNYQDQCNITERTDRSKAHPSHGIGVHDIFTVEDIVGGIEAAMLRKMNSLGSRVKTQQDRLDKLNKLK